MKFKKLISTSLACLLLFSAYPVSVNANEIKINISDFSQLEVRPPSNTFKDQDSNLSRIDGNKDYFMKNGSSFATPQTITINKDYFMNINSNSTNDFYVQFTVPSDGFIHLKYKKIKDSSGNIGDWYVDIENSASQIIVDGATEYEPISKDDYHHYVVGVKKGTYRAKISSAFYVNSGNWSLPFRVNFTATNNFEKENNDTLKSATPISINKLYTAITQEGRYLKNEVDYFKFSIGSKSDVNFKINSPNNSSFYDFDLYDSNGRLIDYANSDYDMSLQRDTLAYSFNNLSSGTYYLQVYSSAKKVPYHFSLDATPRNSNKPTSSLTKDIYKYDAGKGKYLTYINGKGYSQYSYLNKAGTYAFTPSSWMTAAGLHVSMPNSENNYKMNIENAYKIRYEYAQKVLVEAKKGNITPFEIASALENIEKYHANTDEVLTKATPPRTLTKDIYKYNAGTDKYATYINGKGYSQYVYLNKGGTYAFTPSSWMKAAGLEITMPSSSNGYVMKITNPYLSKYNETVKQIKSYL